MPFTVAVIDSNGTMIEDHTGDINKIRDEITNQINKLVTNIDKFVAFVDVDNPQKMIELAVDKCKMIPNVTMGYTTTCYEDNNLIYQLIHVHHGNNDAVESENNKINAIATTLAENKTPIFNCSILTCSIMDENGINFVPTNVTKQHLIDLIKLRSCHKGILIDENSSAVETTFIFDPYECFDLIIKSNKENGDGENLEPNMSLINIVLGGFDIVCVCDKNANAKLNHFASFMFKLEIKGACLMYIRHKGSDFINFDQVFFDKIKTLLSNDKREELVDAKQQDYLIKQYRLVDTMLMSLVK